MARTGTPLMEPEEAGGYPAGVASDGVLYRYAVAESEGALIAAQVPTLEEIWRVTQPSDALLYGVADGVLYGLVWQHGHSEPKWLHALDASTGARLWYFPPDGIDMKLGRSPALGGGVAIVFDASDGILYALAAN